MSRKIILIKQELLLLVYELNRSGLLAENEKIRPILAQLEKLLLCDLSPSTNDSVKIGRASCRERVWSAVGRAGRQETRQGRLYGRSVGRHAEVFFSSRRRHTRSVSAFLLNRSSDLKAGITTACLRIKSKWTAG